MKNQHWKQIPISKVYLGLYDGPHATPKPSDEGPVFLGIGNITDDGYLDLSDIRHIAEDDFPRWTKRVKPQPKDIVFTYEATLNRYAIIPQGFRGCLGRRLALIRPNLEVIDNQFLYYYFFGEEWRRLIASKIIPGATVERIPLIDFPNFTIRIPGLEIQQNIASILSAYDDLIENNTRRIKILEEMAQAIYKEWFVNFRFPGHKKVKFVNSPLGKIPEGWEVVKVDDVASVCRGRSYKSENLTLKGIPFLNLKCITRDGGFRYDGIKYYTGEFKESQTAVAGDIIMAVTDMTQERRIVARVARVPKLDEVLAVLSMDLVKVVPNKEIDQCYMYGMFRYSGFADLVKQHASGVNVLHLSHECITNFNFVLAPHKIRTDYGSIALPLFEECDLLQLKNENLRRTRDLLLPKLISGEVQV